jgi:hypothetical protein
MAEAFRQLDAMTSLGEEEKVKVPKMDPKRLHVTAKAPPTQAAAPEKEMQVYADMVSELEKNEDAEAYSDMLREMGGSVQPTDDTYSAVMDEMGGTPVRGKPEAKEEEDEQATSFLESSPQVGLTTGDPAERDQFMDAALQEALQDVKVNNPELTDSILDDKEIMKEIESIFEQGNEKLMATLEEIRQEQVRGRERERRDCLPCCCRPLTLFFLPFAASVGEKECGRES